MRILSIERFLSKIHINDSCWEWTARKNRNGYGGFDIPNKTVLAHRFIFEYYHGTICPDLTIDHLCRNRGCVNPTHLEQVSIKVNTMRGTSFSAVNSRKTHCIHGHEFSEQNTIQRKNDNRGCKTCRIIQCKEYNNIHREEGNKKAKEYRLSNREEINRKQREKRYAKRTLS